MLARKLADEYVGIVLLPLWELPHEIVSATKFDIEVYLMAHQAPKTWNSRCKPIIARYNESARRKNRVKAIAFEIPDMRQSMIMLITHHHVEPILEVLARIEEQITLQHWSVGVIAGRQPRPLYEYCSVEFMRLQPCDRGREDLPYADTYYNQVNSLVLRVLGRWTHVILRRAHDTLADPSNSMDGERDFRDVHSQESYTIEYVDSISTDDTAEETRSSPYDPIVAQFNEIRNSMAQNVLTIAQDLDQRFRKMGMVPNFPQYRLDLPFSLDTIRQFVNQRSNALNDLTLSKIKSRDMWAVRKLRYTYDEFSDLIAYMNTVADATVYRDEGFRVSGLADLRAHMFAAAQQLVNDLMKRVTQDRGSSLSHQIVTIPGETLSIQRLDLPIDNYPEVLSLLTRPLHTIMFPTHLAMRLGSFPLMAHLVAHEVIAQHRRSRVTFSLIEQDPYGSDTEMLAHAVAADLMGPAYIYALSRFGTSGFRSSVFSFTLQESANIETIVNTCAAIVRSNIPGLEFKGLDLQNVAEVVDEELLHDSHSLIGHPYAVIDHRATMPRLQEALMRGKVLRRADSVLVLNALWDAVVNTKPYVNEIAAVLSMADRAVGT